MKKYKIIWTTIAKWELKDIYDYYRLVKKTPQGAQNVRKDILKAVGEIVFPSQYQEDEIQREYRRIVVRHWKVIYKFETDSIIILRIFSSHQNPNKQNK